MSKQRQKLIAILGVLSLVLVVVFAVATWYYNEYFLNVRDGGEVNFSNYNSVPVNNTDSVNAATNTPTVDDATAKASTLGIKLLSGAGINEYGEITTYQFTTDNTLSVMPLSFESMVFNETPVAKREPIKIDQTDAELLTTTSAKDGSAASVVEVKTDKYLFIFRGSDEFLNDLSAYVQFN